jgi:hypothetical protein
MRRKAECLLLQTVLLQTVLLQTVLLQTVLLQTVLLQTVLAKALDTPKKLILQSSTHRLTSFTADYKP